MLYKCFEQCVHFPVTPELIELAEEDEKKIESQHRKSVVDRDINARRHFYGSLCQHAVIEGIRNEWGVFVEESLYFNPAAARDEGWDFRHRSRDDIKGRWIGEVNGHPRTTIVSMSPFWVNCDQHMQKEGKIDYYVFAAVDFTQDIVHVAGVISWFDVEKIGKRIEGQWMRWQILARQTKGFRSHIFGT